MTALVWDQVGTRFYETGVDRGVLYLPNAQGVYDTGFAWNGLTTVTEKPSGADANPQYADNIKYLNLISAEDFSATIEAFTYPDEFAQCDGTVALSSGLTIGQQARKTFGLAYRSRLGNDLLATDYGYKLHLIYGALASPTEKAYATINDSPEAINFSWDVSTTPIDVPGYKPTAIVTLDSVKIGAAKMAEIEAVLYGAVGVNPKLPTPAELNAMMPVLVVATPTVPAYNATTHTITIPVVVGVVYKIDGKVVTGDKILTTGQSVLVTAEPASGYKFPTPIDRDWLYTY